jgi:hypothetical protein
MRTSKYTMAGPDSKRKKRGECQLEEWESERRKRKKKREGGMQEGKEGRGQKIGNGKGVDKIYGRVQGERRERKRKIQMERGEGEGVRTVMGRKGWGVEKGKGRRRMQRENGQ